MGSSNKALLAVLAGAWRDQVEYLTLSLEELEQVTPSITARGLGGFLSRRIDPRYSGEQFFLQLQGDFRLSRSQAIVHEIQVRDVFSRMHSAGVEPILFKGLALARHYPDSGLRPYGDIDLWLPADRLAEGYEALRRNGEVSYCVDLHTSFYPNYERTLDDVFEKSRVVNLDGVKIRVPSPEDHLRFNCLHFLHHGGWRPLWLCDVALMVEKAGSEFDWDRCLYGKEKHADWIACVIGLAHQLLGADVRRTPVSKRAAKLPRWLPPALLRQWDKGPGMSFAENLSFSLPRRLLKPTALIQAFREHWRNPIQASVEMNAWFGNSPRAFLQLGSVFTRIPEFARLRTPR